LPSGASRFARRARSRPGGFRFWPRAFASDLEPSPPLRGLRAARCVRSPCFASPCRAAHTVTSAHESFAPTRTARTPLVTEPSRHRLESDAVRLRRGRGLAEGSYDPASRTLRSRERASSSRAPATPRFRRPPAARSRFHGKVHGPNDHTRHLLAQGQRAARHGWMTRPLAQRITRAKGAASPGAPRRAHEISCTRGAFHR